MSAIAAFPNRVITVPKCAFISCSRLPVKQEILDQKTMGEISGEGFWMAVAVGVSIYAVTHPQEAVTAVDWYTDRISEGVNFVGNAVNSLTSGVAEGMTNWGY